MCNVQIISIHYMLASSGVRKNFVACRINQIFHICHVYGILLLYLDWAGSVL